MQIGIPRELQPGERRVAATPESVVKLKKLGFEVVVERGAGAEASFPDTAYTEAGATVVEAEALWGQADLIAKINPLTEAELSWVRPGQVLISLVFPAENRPLVDALAGRGATLIALDQIPRISRAQKMDVLSSMANIAGYRAIIEAAAHFGGFFGAQMTAAGKSPPAKVLVIGAGVAGLAAIAAARGLGAEVRAFDTRKAVKEQVQSLGGRFLELDVEEDGEGAGGYAKEVSPAFIAAEMALFNEQAAEVDVVVTTALIPGKRAPILWTEEAVSKMRPGSVVVDLAARNGGNCALTRPGEVVQVGGVTVIGHTDLTCRLPTVSSRFFAQNIVHLLTDMVGKEGFHIDHEDEAVRGALVLERGALLWPAPKPAGPPPQAPKPTEKAAPAAPKHGETPPASGLATTVAAVIAVLVFGFLGRFAPREFLEHFTVFVLACVVGWQVVWSVTPALHTPLMSVTNAISGIIVVGGLLQAGAGTTDLAAILGAVAILVATINIAGGFLVTQRMLAMFRKQP